MARNLPCFRIRRYRALGTVVGLRDCKRMLRTAVITQQGRPSFHPVASTIANCSVAQLLAQATAKSAVVIFTAACARVKWVRLARTEFARSKATTKPRYHPTSILAYTQQLSSCDQLKMRTLSVGHMSGRVNKTRKISLPLASRAQEEKHACWLYPFFSLPTRLQTSSAAPPPKPFKRQRFACCSSLPSRRYSFHHSSTAQTYPNNACESQTDRKPEGLCDQENTARTCEARCIAHHTYAGIEFGSRIA